MGRNLTEVRCAESTSMAEFSPPGISLRQGACPTALEEDYLSHSFRYRGVEEQADADSGTQYVVFMPNKDSETPHTLDTPEPFRILKTSLRAQYPSRLRCIENIQNRRQTNWQHAWSANLALDLLLMSRSAHRTRVNIINIHLCFVDKFSRSRNIS